MRCASLRSRSRGHRCGDRRGRKFLDGCAHRPVIKDDLYFTASDSTKIPAGSGSGQGAKHAGYFRSQLATRHYAATLRHTLTQGIFLSCMQMVCTHRRTNTTRIPQTMNPIKRNFVALSTVNHKGTATITLAILAGGECETVAALGIAHRSKYQRRLEGARGLRSPDPYRA